MLRAIQHPHSTALSTLGRRRGGKTEWPLPTYSSSVAALLGRASAVDPTFQLHADNVAALSMRVAEELGLDRDEVELIGVAAAVHDVGKIGIPAAIIAKPGALDAEEWELMQRHPSLGAELLGDSDVPPAVAAIVRSHHERWDGAGYPDGLRGDEIPFGARIVAVTDAYCAMLEERPYRPPVRPHEARAELRIQAGRQFDPECAAACRFVSAR